MNDVPLDSRQFEFLKNTLERNIVSFRGKRDASRKLAFRLKLLTAVMGTLATIFLGLKAYPTFKDHDEILSVSALTLSAMIPVFAAWDAFFDYRWLWIRYTATLNILYGIRDEMEYGQAGGLLPGEKMGRLFDRMQSALGETDSDWARKRQKDHDQAAAQAKE